MTDKYAQLREALAKATPGPWNSYNDQVEKAEDLLIAQVFSGGFQDAMPFDSHDAAYIAAANPDTIAALLAERDALAALLDHPQLCEVLGDVEDAGPADVWGAAQSWMEARAALGEKP